MGAKFVKGEKGFSLIEVMLAMTVLGLVAVAFLGGLFTASRTVLIADERATAESIGRSQMEYVRSQPYSEASWNYTVCTIGRSSTDPPENWWDEDNNPPLLSSDYDGYSVSVNVEGLLEAGVDNCIQRMIVVVYFPSYDAEHPNKQITLVGYRTMR